MPDIKNLGLVVFNTHTQFLLEEGGGGGGGMTFTIWAFFTITSEYVIIQFVDNILWKINIYVYSCIFTILLSPKYQKLCS